MFMSCKNRNVHKYLVTVSACALMASLGLAQAQVAPAEETTEQTAERLAREQGFIRRDPTPEELEQAAFDTMVGNLEAMIGICDRDPEFATNLENEIDELADLYLTSGVERFQDDPKDTTTAALITKAQECLEGFLATQGWMDGRAEFSDRDPDIDEKIKKALAYRSDARLEAAAITLADALDPDTPQKEVEDTPPETAAGVSTDPEPGDDMFISDGNFGMGNDFAEMDNAEGPLEDLSETPAEPKGGVVQDGYQFPVGEEETEIDDDYEDAWVPRIRGWVGAGQGKISDRGAISAGTEIFGPEEEAPIVSAVVDEVSLFFVNVEVAAPKLSGPDFLAGLFKDVRFTGGVTVMEGDENGARDIDSGGTTDIGLVYSDIVDTSSSSTSTGVFFENSFDIDTRAEAEVERLNVSLGVAGTAGSIYDDALSVALKAMYTKDEVKSSSLAEVDVAALFGAGTANSVQTNDLETDRESYGINVHAVYEHDLNSFNLGSVKVDAGFTVGANAGVEYYDSEATFSQLTTGDAGVVGSGEASVAFDDTFDDSGFGVQGGVFAEIGLGLYPDDGEDFGVGLSFGISYEELGGGYPVYDQAFSPLGQPSGWDTERVDMTTTYVRLGLEF